MSDMSDIQTFRHSDNSTVYIEVAFKMFGKGDPILLISPAQADMNAWELSANLSELSQIIQ